MPQTETVRYLYNRKKGEVILLFRPQAWAARNLKAKGLWGLIPILSRPMTEAEQMEAREAKRLRFMRYVSWEGLFEDEQAEEIPAEVINQLRAFALTHPLSGQFSLDSEEVI